MLTWLRRLVRAEVVAELARRAAADAAVSKALEAEADKLGLSLERRLPWYGSAYAQGVAERARAGLVH